MRVLLDTNVLIWMVGDSPRLSARARDLIKGAERVFVSAVSIWEIAIKAAVRKFEDDTDMIISVAEASGFAELPVTWEHSRLVQDLPFHHSDPFDRLLVAQAVSEPLNLLTSDRLLHKYSDLIVEV